MRWGLPIATGLALVALALLVPAAARGLQLAFVVAGAPVVGAFLLLAIGRVTGADWSAAAPLVGAMPLVLALGLAAMLASAPLPPHLAVWQHPAFAAVRVVAVLLALWWVGVRVARGASVTLAAVALAVYAWLVTPIATDWLLAAAPGHAVSAIGMMLAVQQIGAACALLLASGVGSSRLRRDLSALLAATALGLTYLAFVDYLIIWFGNLPAKVPFYVTRTRPGDALLIGAALLAGLVLPIAALSLMTGERGRRIAGAAALAGLFLFDLWWIGAGWLGAAVALVLIVAIGAYGRRYAHG